MANFTPQQIEQFLQEFFDVVGTRQYIGARYVPILGRRGETSIEWDNSAPYEPLTIVMHEGNSYTSKQYVPADVDILNTEYWVMTANYNAQIDYYRQEVLNVQTSFTEFKNEMQDEFDTNAQELEADYEQTKTNLIAEVNAEVADIREEFYATKYMVVIGDSFSNDSQSGTPLWYTYVARQKGLTPYSNAKDGRGFGAYLGHSDHTFTQQAQQAANELPHDDVEMVYVVGGLNDTTSPNYDGTAFFNGVRSVLNILTSNFTKAKIEFYGPTSFPQINANARNAAILMTYACAQYGVEYHDLSAKFNLYPDFFGGNGSSGLQISIHPSAMGERIIAQAILSHGVLPLPQYREASLPASMYIPPILKALYYYDYEDGTTTRVWKTADSSILQHEVFTTPDCTSFEWCVSFDPITIPNTTSMLALTIPYGFGWLVDYDGSHSIAGEISQVTKNAMFTGWVEKSQTFLNLAGAPVLQFVVNRSDLTEHDIKTGVSREIRVRFKFHQRG